MFKPEWSIENYGGKVHIDDYESIDWTKLIANVDLETNGKEITSDKFELVEIGICNDGINAYCFFAPFQPKLWEYLRKCQIIAHSGKRAEIPWLNHFDSKITIDQLYFDTQTTAYVYDSSRRSYHFKSLVEEIFGVKYPAYIEIIENPDYINFSCRNNESLYIKKQLKPTKKTPNPAIEHIAPKVLTLDKMDREVTAQYNSCDIVWGYRLWTWYRQHFNAAQWAFFNNIEMPMTRLLYHSEQLGIKVDPAIALKSHKQYLKQMVTAKKEFIAWAEDSIGTTRYVEELKKLYKKGDKIQEYPGILKDIQPNNWRHVLALLRASGYDVEATDEDTLTKFVGEPLIDSLLKFREYFKLCTTYTKPLFKESMKTVDNRIHVRFEQNTITGRLSSSDPVNLQNQPSGIRDCFVSEKGYFYIDADWKNIELYLPAHFSQEKFWLEELTKPDGNMHRETCKRIFGDAVLSLPDIEYKVKYHKAKTCNFLLTNSGTYDRLAIELGISREEGKELFDKWWNTCPAYARWVAFRKRQARLDGGVRTWFGRWVSFPQLKLWCGNPNCAKVNKYCKQCFMREEAEREAISVIVQGTAADMMKQSALRLYREFGYVPVNYIHDELLYEVPDNQVDEVSKNVKYVMENITKLCIPLKVDLNVGKDWKSAKGK